MTNDILSWYPTDSSVITSNLNEIGAGVGSINVLNFILSLFFVLIIIYGIYFLLQLINKNKNKPQEHLLKRINISQNLTIDFIQINKKLYILANNQNSLELLDVIKQEKEILEILSEDSEHLDKKTLNEKFENALKSILRKTDEIENLKK
ncbi:MAG: hypothetical protein PHF25_04175 [Candidatus Margulisbacteria bacterium]|nr:hypothetical protein [Candidatus Margulisiibacteriota bacterium]